jgi:hypothetical protein
VTDKSIARIPTTLLGACALAALAACGGGGAGADPGVPAAGSAAAPDSSGAPAAGSLAPQSAPLGSDPTAVSSAPASDASGAASGTTGTATASGSAAAPTVAAAGPVPTLGDCQLFPARAIFNTRIDDPSRFPADPNSSRWVDLVGRSLPFGPDWGVNTNPASYQTYWGVPINVIDAGGTDWPVVSFDFSTSGVSWEQGYPFKSDCAVPDGSGFGITHDCTSVQASQRHFPFPRDNTLLSEGGACNDPNGCGDHHLLVVEKGACRLWESFFSYKLGGQWYSMATAAWDLNSLALRPDNWASADAAGLPITPLLAKTAEADSGEIRHALRVTFRDAALSLQHVWPARFAAGADNPGAIPFGSLLRLKADFAIPDNWSTQAKAIATAAKRYGMYAADNGADFYVQGEPNAGWDPATWQQLRSITMDNMEFVDLSSITKDARFSPDSMAASW